MKKNLQKLFVFFVLFTLFISPVWATNYYVNDATGANTNSGLTTALAKKTIQAASNLTNPGDTVFIMNGNYASTSYNNQTIVDITRSGTDGNYITYKPYPGHSPKLVHSTTLTYQCWNAIHLDGSYVVLDGLEIEGNNASQNYTYAYQLWQDYEAGNPDYLNISRHNAAGISIGKFKTVHHVVVRNCKVHDAASGIGGGKMDYVTIENNTVYNNCWYTQYATSGISVLGPKDFDAVTSTKIIIRNNVVYGNKTLIPWEQTNALSDGNGIILDVNTGYGGRTLIENNLSYNNGGGGVHAFKAAHIDIINNTAYNNGTVVGYPEIDANQCSDVKIYNNIMYARTGGNCNGNDANTIYDYNLYFNGLSFKNGPHDKTGNPQFVLQALDATANLQLKNTSPAINNGSSTAGQFSPVDILGVARPVGFSTDMGAYEYATVIPRPEIKISQGTTEIVDNTGSFDFGDVASTAPKTVTFTIDNMGDLALNLTGTPRVSLKTGTAFSVVVDAPATVAANGSATFQITLTPSSTAAVYSDSIRIDNSDADENPFNFAITGYGYDGTKALQTITFNPIPVKTIGMPDFDPGATSNAGLPVSYTSSNTNVATIVAGKIHLVNPGTSTITASQAGDAATNPAKNVTQLLTVTPVLPPPGTNMVSNPTFDVNTAGWSFAYRNGGAATVTSVPMAGSSTNVGKVVVSNIGTTTGIDNVQLSTRVFLVKDKNYLITFKANADAPRNITLRLLQDGPTFNTLYTVSNIALTTTQSTYGTYAYTSTFTGYVALRFWVATNTIPVYFDDVEMIEEPTIILPISLLSFTGNISGNKVWLNWKTASEINAREFVVESSNNGSTFSAIGTVTAKNILGGNYQFADLPKEGGQVFYRLKMMDKDGSYTYSGVVSFKLDFISSMKLKVYPNPVTNYVTVAFPATSAGATLRVLLADGRTIREYSLPAGATQKSMDVSQLKSGTYFITIRNNKESSTQIFIK